MLTPNVTELFDHDNLRSFAAACLQQVGLRQGDALTVAHTLVESDMRGVQSHGLALLPRYLRRLSSGAVKARPDISVIRETECLALMDGDNGLGQLAGVRAMEVAIRKARNHGLGAVAVRNANHFGAAAYYAMLATEADMIGFATSNAASIMPAPGGVSRVVGNDPVAFALPSGEGGPVVVDVALSIVPVNKLRLAAMEGRDIPCGWALNRAGEPTTSPQEAMEGLLLPIGAHKGFGLALVADVLTALLSGGVFAWELHDRQYVGMSHFFLALDVSRFVPLAEFKARMTELVARIHSSQTVPGVERLYAPGEIEAECKRKRLTSGVPLPSGIVEELKAVAVEIALRLQLNPRPHK